MIEPRIVRKMEDVSSSDFSVTYRLNKKEGIFSWYPYAEGFSKPFVDAMIDYFGIQEGDLVLDPFGGCGTTMLGCTLKNINSVSVEVNPFMDFVLKGKYEPLKINPSEIEVALSIINKNISKVKKAKVTPTFLKDKIFFNPSNLNQALIIKEAINELDSSDKLKRFFMLHLSSIIVKISDMIRATDLKYRDNPQEELDVKEIFSNKVRGAIEDLKEMKIKKLGKAIFIHEDIGLIQDKAEYLSGKIDYFITSPPYLNGTNYERNTKLEMGFLDMIQDESDLKRLRSKMITAGINSTQSDKSQSESIKFIQPLVNKVAENAYDKRIPMMVRGYFNDMDKAIKNIYFLLKKGGRGVIVIGDSQFGGVHIPTDLILAQLCELNRFKIEKMQSVRERHSRNGMKLRESLIFVRK